MISMERFPYRIQRNIKTGPLKCKIGLIRKRTRSLVFFSTHDELDQAVALCYAIHSTRCALVRTADDAVPKQAKICCRPRRENAVVAEIISWC